MVRSMPWVDEPSSAEELIGGIVLDGPFNLTVGEGIAPLEVENSEVDRQREWSAEPPFPLATRSWTVSEVSGTILSD